MSVINENWIKITWKLLMSQIVLLKTKLKRRENINLLSYEQHTKLTL